MMDNVIVTLLDLNWTPTHPTQWREERGNLLQHEDDITDFSPLLAEIGMSVYSKKWEQTAKHHRGKGLEQGPDLTVAQRHFKKLSSQGLRGHAGMLQCIVAGATWTPARRFDAGLADSS